MCTCSTPSLVSGQTTEPLPKHAPPDPVSPAANASILDGYKRQEYPYRDKQEKECKNRLRGMAYQGTLSSNKSLNRFVFAIGSAPIFSLYSVNKDNIDKSFELSLIHI